MTQNKNQNFEEFVWFAMFKFLPTSGFKCIDPKEFDWINILAILWKDVLLKLILNTLKNYMNYRMIILFAPDKIEIKREMLSDKPCTNSWTMLYTEKQCRT